MKLKRITANLAVILLLFTGCGNSQEVSTTTEVTTQQATTTEQTTEAETESTDGNSISKDDNIYYDLDIDELEKLANDGDAKAQFSLGRLYDWGEEVPQDYQKAFEWYSKAANQSNNYAQYALGFMYYNGAGTTQNQQKGLEWLNKAAEQGNENAINFLKKLGVPTATQPTDLNANILKEGTYRVGKDIPAGEYIVIPNEGKSCYYEVSADSSGNSIITNENVDGQDYITLEEGQYFKIKRGTAQLAD